MYFCNAINTIIIGIDEITAAAEKSVQCAANWFVINDCNPNANVIFPGVCKNTDEITYSLYVAMNENKKITISCGLASGKIIL